MATNVICENISLPPPPLKLCSSYLRTTTLRGGGLEDRECVYELLYIFQTLIHYLYVLTHSTLCELMALQS